MASALILPSVVNSCNDALISLRLLTHIHQLFQYPLSHVPTASRVGVCFR
jgi:hypothetical protein